MGEQTPVSQPELVELAPRDLRLGQRFRPFESLTSLPVLRGPEKGKIERVLIRAPFRFIGIDGAVIVGTDGTLTRQSEKHPWQNVPQIGVEFNIGRAVTRDFDRISGYYLRVYMDGKVRGVQIGDPYRRQQVDWLREDFKKRVKQFIEYWG